MSLVSFPTNLPIVTFDEKPFAPPHPMFKGPHPLWVDGTGLDDIP